jgi:serine/threonine protein kinase
MALTATLLDDRYVLDEPIGAGGYCEVWRATDTVLARPVAVKLLHAGYARHGEALARFKAEARHAGGLSHKNIARVYDYGEPADGQPYLVMELVDGPSLADVLAGGPLPAAPTMDIVAQVAAGLQAAHAAGLIHRDIKPANILFARGGAVRITDFGIAHAVGSAPVTSTGAVMGTPGYIAPERVAGAQAGPASDLYALGVVAYECLAGSPPFSGGALDVALAHRNRPLPPLPASVPAEVVVFVMTLTAKDPRRRPRSAGEVARQAGGLRDALLPNTELPNTELPSTKLPSTELPSTKLPSTELTDTELPDTDSAWPVPAARSAGAPPTVPDALRGQAVAAAPSRPRAPRPRRRGALTVAALALAALTCLVLVSITGFTPGSHPADPPSTARSQAAPTPSARSATSQPVAQPSSAHPAADTHSPGPAAGQDSPGPAQDTGSGNTTSPGQRHHKNGHGHGNGDGNSQ